MAAWGALGKGAWILVKKYWPLLLNAWNAVDDYVKKHPGITTQARARFEKWRAAFVEAQKKRSPETRISATLNIVRRLAEDRLSSESDESEIVAQVGGPGKSRQRSKAHD
ncbi:hypothetical protein [Pengzhenrongella sp.]|jgi:hypothetical protein|uniref:hypothetical protein n=1 Tax=Pengzhenrongella sp. TaxID=2888820 RepID=UPI002F930FD5